MINERQYELPPEVYRVDPVESHGWRVHGPGSSEYFPLDKKHEANARALTNNTIYAAGLAAREEREAEHRAQRIADQNEIERLARDTDGGWVRVVREGVAGDIATQDNRITAHPIFAVRQEVKIYGVDAGHREGYEWFNPQDPEEYADAELVAELERKNDDFEDVSPWEEVGYVTRWEFVTACFTEQGCKDYLAANGHNLNKPQIYAYSAYRNAEWQAMREAIRLAQAAPPTTTEGEGE